MAEPDDVGNANERWEAVARELSDAAAHARERATANAVATRADEQVAAIETQLSEAVERARLEAKDVDELTRVSGRSIIAILKRSRGTDLEREQAELEAARGLAGELAARRNELVKTQAEADARRRSYRDADRRLANALAAKDELFRQLGGPTGERLAVIAAQRGELAAQGKELREAIDAGQAAVRACDALLDELGSAGSWSTFDLLGGGLITSAIKHDHMDSAASASRSVDRLVAAFRRELGDVRIDPVLEALDLSPTTRFVDTWLDNIFTDLSVHSRIGEARANAERIRSQVSSAVQGCTARLTETDSRQTDLEQERDTLLRSARSPLPAPTVG